jgi:hypothetical protein
VSLWDRRINHPLRTPSPPERSAAGRRDISCNASSRRPARVLEGDCRFFCNGFECFGATRDNLTVDQLPAYSFLDEEGINRGRELMSSASASLIVMYGHVPAQGFNNVVDLEPLAVIHQRLRFIPDIRILAPVSWVRPNTQDPAEHRSERRWSPVELAGSFEDRYPEAFRRIFFNRNFFGRASVVIAVRLYAFWACW